MVSDDMTEESGVPTNEKRPEIPLIPGVSDLGLAFGLFALAALVVWGLPWIFVDRPGAQISSLILVVGGMYLGFLKKIPDPSKRFWWRRSLGLVYLLVGFLIPWSDGPEAEMPWQAFDEALLLEARENNQPVMIDFTAAWCGPCQVMESQVFSRQKIVDAAEGFLTLRADMTRSEDPEVQALGQRFSIMAFPTVVFIGADGEERTRLRLVGLEWAEKFEQRLAAVQ